MELKREGLLPTWPPSLVDILTINNLSLFSFFSFTAMFTMVQLFRVPPNHLLFYYQYLTISPLYFPNLYKTPARDFPPGWTTKMSWYNWLFSLYYSLWVQSIWVDPNHHHPGMLTHMQCIMGILMENLKRRKTSLLSRLQAQTLPDASPPIGKIHPFSKITISFEPVMRFGFPSRFRMS